MSRAALKRVAVPLLTLRHRFVGSVRFRRAVLAAQKAGRPVNVAVGTGHVTYPGWINTDIDWHADYYLDLVSPWPVPPGSVARIFGDNVIEHFTVPHGRLVLREMYRALEAGGGIRLATPDVERTARAYLDNTQLAQQHLARHRNHGYDVYYPVDLLRVTFAESKHYLGFCYDYAALATELERAGFVNVTRYEAGESDDERFRGLETRLGETEAATSLIVEAWKPVG